MLTQPLSSGRCHGSIVAASCTNWKRWGRKLCHRPLVRPWTCLPLRSEVKEVENSAAAETWRQTRRPGITESAGAALLSEPSGVNTQLASLWVHSQQNGIKSRPPQNIIMACKMRRAKEDVCCIRVVSTVYMCGLDLSGLWQKMLPKMHLPILFWLVSPKTRSYFISWS